MIILLIIFLCLAFFVLGVIRTVGYHKMIVASISRGKRKSAIRRRTVAGIITLLMLFTLCVFMYAFYLMTKIQC